MWLSCLISVRGRAGQCVWVSIFYKYTTQNSRPRPQNPMKSRLAASVYPLLAGEWSRHFCKPISLTSKFSTFNGRCHFMSRFCYIGLQIPIRGKHTSTIEDDFSELGPPVAGNAAMPLKLVTEKVEPVLHKADSGGKASLSRSFPAESRSGIKDTNPNLHKSFQTSNFKLQDYNDVSTLAINHKGSLQVDCKPSVSQKGRKDSSCSISVQNVPSTLSLSDLVQAISAFGKICSACFRSSPDGSTCCDVDFENSESSMRAVLAGGITVESVHLPIRPLHSPEIVSIRIQGIGKETTDRTIHTICKSIGALEGLAKAGKDAVDAFFRVKNDAELQTIVKRLNGMKIDDYCWSACQLPSNTTSSMIMEKEDAKSTLGLLMNNRLFELKGRLDCMKMYYEDLQLLHLEVLHLGGLPTTRNPCHPD